MPGFSIGFISSQLTADKLILVNPRATTGPPKMSLLLEAKSTPALIIKPSVILVAYMDDLCWYIKSNQQGQMFVQNLIRIVSKQNATPGQILYCTTDCIPIHLMFHENFPTNTQAWNRLSHRDDCRQREMICVTYGNLVTATHILGQAHPSSGGKVFYDVHEKGRQPTDCNRTQLRSQRLKHHDGSWCFSGPPNHPQKEKGHAHPQPA